MKKAWTYYEHVTLPRYKTGDDNADTVFSRAEPGEYVNETELYDWLRMKQSTLIEWGTGIDLYFISVRFFAALMFVCGLINLPAMLYYASDEYNGDSVQDYQPSLKASAVCNNTEWVACTDCTESDWQPDTSRMRFGTSEAGERTTLVLRNSCNGASAAIGYTNFATLAFVLVAVGLFSYYLRAREIRFDEDKVTTTDYSVVVQNPPPDAIDPEVWRDFFSKFATDGDQVTAITITLNNEVMVRKLLTRRVFMNQLRIKLPPDLNMDDKEAVIEAAKKYNEEKEAEPPSCVGRILDCIVVPICNIFNMLLPPDALVTKIEKLTEEIKVLQEKTYTATNVFITFEKESGQRTALEAMKVGLIDLFLNRTSAIAPDNVFDDRVLRVLEPTEPNAVRWLDLSYGLTSKIVRRGIALSLTVGMIAVAGVAVKYTRDALGVFYSGLLTTTFNSTIPQIIKILMSFEPHATEGAYQASLYLKITLFRWTLSAILAQVRICMPLSNCLRCFPLNHAPPDYYSRHFHVGLRKHGPVANNSSDSSLRCVVIASPSTLRLDDKYLQACLCTTSENSRGNESELSRDILQPWRAIHRLHQSPLCCIFLFCAIPCWFLLRCCHSYVPVPRRQVFIGAHLGLDSFNWFRAGSV